MKINLLKWFTMSLVIITLMTRCTKDENFLQDEVKPTSENDATTALDSVPTTSPFISKSKPTGTREVMVLLPSQKTPVKVTAEIIDGYLIMEGDIILGTEKEMALEKSIAIADLSKRWRNGVIPYVIRPGHLSTSDIQTAIRTVNARTNLFLVERTTEADYVEFVEAEDCWSWYGRRGGRQEIRIAAGCGISTTIHEILHAAGLLHEQSRCDRDTYVTIHWDNIQDGRSSNFNRHCSDAIDIGPYDYNSIMHYSEYAFSKNDRPTITVNIPPAAPGTRLGSSFMSAGDINAINAIYSQSTGKHLFLYQNSTGRGEIYELNNDCSLGAMTDYGDYRTTWDIIEPFTVDGGKYVLFYENDRGHVEIYKLNATGSLGSMTYSSTSWRRTWTMIKPYVAGGNEYLLFYDRDRGYEEIYQLRADGSLGTRTQVDPGWRTTWDIIQPYEVNGNAYLLFYENDRGHGEIYQLTAWGTVNTLTFATTGWSRSWRIIQPYVSGDNEYLFFYNSEGFAQTYELRDNGTLGRQTLNDTGWRRTWSNIEPFELYGKTYALFFDQERREVEVYDLPSNGRMNNLIYSNRGWRSWNVLTAL